ncbi:MAG: hypothetical protein NTX22_06100 [Ignavibacteriales bacterium]|nr:hypothetical protein [Ignavibacteriales bacterium]
MTVTTKFPEMTGTALLKGYVDSGVDLVGFDYGNGNLNSHIEFEPGSAPGDFNYAVVLPANATDFRVRAKAQVYGSGWVYGAACTIPTTPNSKFGGGGKTLILQ